jgi:lysozyme
MRLKPDPSSFFQDLRRFENAVNGSVAVSLEQNQFDALVSFSFNVGVGAFTGSTLLKKLNAGSYDDVPGELMKWTKGGGKTLQGLVNRRQGKTKGSGLNSVHNLNVCHLYSVEI